MWLILLNTILIVAPFSAAWSLLESEIFTNKTPAQAFTLTSNGDIHAMVQ
jgi:hypothetical protein